MKEKGPRGANIVKNKSEKKGKNKEEKKAFYIHGYSTSWRTKALMKNFSSSHFFCASPPWNATRPCILSPRGEFISVLYRGGVKYKVLPRVGEVSSSPHTIQLPETKSDAVFYSFLLSPCFEKKKGRIKSSASEINGAIPVIMQLPTFT